MVILGINIIVCEDNTEQLNIIREYFRRFKEETSNNINLKFFISPKELVNDLRDIEILNTDIFILDINMEGMQGLELASYIRGCNSRSLIIFQTAFKEYAFDAFKVRAFNYILKPFEYKDFKLVMNEAIHHLKESVYSQDSQGLIYTSKEFFGKIPLNSIYYFEKTLRKVKVVLLDKEIEINESLKTIQNQLKDNKFLRCHQGYIVNLEKIAFYKNQGIVLKDINYTIPVSKGHSKEVKHAIINYLI